MTLAESKFRFAVLEGFIYFLSEEGNNRLPNFFEFITSEFLAGAYQYSLGKPFNPTWARYRRGMSDAWPEKVNRKLKVLLRMNRGGWRVKNRLPPELLDALEYWIKTGWSHDRGESWWDNQIRHWFMFNENINKMNSTFSLTVRDVKDAAMDLASLAACDPSVPAHLEGIARAALPYLEADLAHISEYYRW